MAQPTQGDDSISGRLNSVFGRMSNAEVAERITAEGQKVSEESVRRYRGGMAERIPVDFVADVARIYEADAAWLLTGRRGGASSPAVQPTPNDRAVFDEVKEILRNQEIAPGLRVLLIDAATSAWTKAALYRGEVAGEERARAVHQAELTQAARTEAIREVEKHAGERFRVLHSEASPVELATAEDAERFARIRRLVGDEAWPQVERELRGTA